MEPDKLVDLDEPFYTAEQIVVPPELPEILKQFTKAAIKTQPPDLLEWACSYFRARAVGSQLPVKDRLELIPDDYDDLTLGLLKILHREVGHKRILSLSEIEDHWVGLGLSPEKFTEIVEVGQLPSTVEWHRFVVVACAKLTDQLEDIFKSFCLTLTTEPDGNNALIPVATFIDAYTYLAQNVAHIDDNTQERFAAYMKAAADKQNGMVHPGNITYRDAPAMQARPSSSKRARPSNQTRKSEGRGRLVSGGKTDDTTAEEVTEFTSEGE